jgi:serine/threonine protein kinase
MSVAGRLAVLALRPLAEGALDALGKAPGEAAVEPVGEFIGGTLAADGRPFTDALRRALERAWKAVEVALHGGAWLRQISANSDDKPIADQLGKLVIETEAGLARRESQRRLALPELAAARKKNYLYVPPNPYEGMFAALAQGTALYASFDDLELFMQADRSAVHQAADELRQAGFGNLAALLLPDEGTPLVAVAARYFFRRAVHDNPALAEAFAFARFEELLPELQEAFDALYEVITAHGRRLEELLGNVAAAPPEPTVASLDWKAESEAGGAIRNELYRDVESLLRRFDLTHVSVRPHDANLVRNEHERQQARRVVEQFHDLPDSERRTRPALANAVARLELAAGDAAAALRDFEAAAAAVKDPAAQGELHMNAHRAAIVQRDHAAALREFLEAVKLDGRRFATFPVGKYIPMRVLGAGAYGTAFLCKHKYMNSQVVVKALASDGLDREADDIFGEAQTLGAINHPAIIRVQDCGYVDAGRKHRPFLVMDHFDAPTLREYVEQRGPLTVPELIALVEPVAAGLEAAHNRRIVHRDIKPDNLLVKRLPDVGGKPRWEVKLIDFGLALKQQDVLAAPSGSRLGAGTTEYAAPEQLGQLPGVEAGPPSDVYSFGKTCCYALFQTTAPLLRHWKSIPQPLAELLERCLGERPEDRPKDFAIVGRCFARLQQGEDNIPVVGTSGAIRSVPPAVAPTVPTVPVVGRAAEREDDERDYVAPSGGGGGASAGKILFFVFGGLALLFLLVCGGGAGALYFIGKSAEEKTESEIASNDNAARPDRERPRDDFKIPDGAGGGAGPGARGDGDRPAPPRNEIKKHNVTVTGAPNPEVADFVIERLQAADEGRRNAKVISARKNGNDVVAVIEDTFFIQVADWLPDLDLGAIERDGDDFKVALTAPPEPNRKITKPPEGPKLSPQQFQLIVRAFNTRREEREAIAQLKASSPRDEQRATIRTLLKLHAKDPFLGGDALEALGVWGTPEDVPFLMSLDDGGPFGHEHVIKALERMAHPAGASYLARKLDNFFVGEKAYQALRAIGPAAERDVVGVVSGNQKGGAVRACKFLKEFGSTASIGPLKSAAKDKNGDVSKAAWDALKTIAFFPTKPVAPDPRDAIADKGKEKPKTTSTVDDAKVTVLDDAANGVAPNICLASDGKSFYALEPASNVTRRDWDGAILATASAGGMKLMAVNRHGLLLAGSADAKLLELDKLESKNSGPMDNARGLTSAPEVDFAIARCEGAIPTMLVIDVGSFTIATTYADRKAGKALILPPGIGRSDPVLTPDGRFLITQGESRLCRWAVNNNKINSQDSTRSLGTGDGKVIVSPDSRSAALLFRDAASTQVFAVNELKKPAFTVNHGPRVAALAFDGKGHVYAATDAKSLIIFDGEGKRTKEYDLGGATRQIVPSDDGKRVLVLTKDKLLKVELP